MSKEKLTKEQIDKIKKLKQSKLNNDTLIIK